MKHTWYRTLLVGTVITAILLSGCAPKATPGAPPTATAQPPEPPTTEPAEPPAADYPMTVTIKLRQGITWSDGTPLTADDFVFTYEMIMADGNLIQSRYPYDTFVENVVALDDHTIQIGLNDAYVGWPSGLNLTPMPRHILEPIFEAEGTIDNAEWNWNPTVGVGPFVLKEWETASHITFEANPNYWRGGPQVEQLFVRFVPDPEAQMAALETGDADIGVYLTAADKPAVDEMENVELVSVSSGWVESWFFNLISEELAEKTGLKAGHPALQDKLVRRAIVMAIDRQQIIDELFYGMYRIPAVVWYDSPFEDQSIEPWPYDPKAAADLLDQAGWVDSNNDGTRDKDGVELVIQYSTTAGNELREATGVLAQQMLAEVGIGVDILNYSYDVVWNSYGDGGPVASGEYDIAEWSTLPDDFPDPNTAAWTCAEIPSDEYPAGGNWWGVCYEELDELFNKQVVTLDEKERIQVFAEIERIMHEEMFWMGVRTDPDFWALNTRLQNVRLSGSGVPFWNVYEWDTADSEKSITLSFFEEPDNMNPLYTTMWFTSITYDFWLESLWVWDENMNLVPALAEEIPTIENGGIVIADE